METCLKNAKCPSQRFKPPGLEKVKIALAEDIWMVK